MKIFHITPDYNFAIKFVLPVAIEHVRENHQVKICTHRNEYSSTNFKGPSSFENEVEIFDCNVKVRRNFISYLYSIFMLLKEVRSFSPDIVVSHTSIDSFFPLMFIRLFSKKRIVYFNHGVPFLGYSSWMRFLLRVAESLNVRSAHQVFTISAAMKRHLISVASDNDSVKMISPGSACGIPLVSREYSEVILKRQEARQLLGIPQDEKIVIYVGRPVFRKGFFDLLNVWVKFFTEEKTRLLLVGPSGEFRKNNNEFNGSNIYFLGYQADPTIFYLVADVLCIPSHHEGLGYCYLEAAAAGCVPICSDIEGPTDFVKNGFSGLTCKIKDINSIRDCIGEILYDRDLRERLAFNAFQSAIAYDQAVIAPKVSAAILDSERR